MANRMTELLEPGGASDFDEPAKNVTILTVGINSRKKMNSRHCHPSNRKEARKAVYQSPPKIRKLESECNSLRKTGGDFVKRSWPNHEEEQKRPLLCPLENECL